MQYPFITTPGHLVVAFIDCVEEDALVAAFKFAIVLIAIKANNNFFMITPCLKIDILL